uniref:Transmembrane protein n=1 Tax=Phocoena sinus TaxID=42100 RepID=A0A8C9BX05_PHOSS
MVDTAPNGPQEAGAVQFITANKLATAMLLSGLFIVYCSLFCLFLGLFPSLVIFFASYCHIHEKGALMQRVQIVYLC